ncbi:polyketide synthase docking domain-containing protein, partial [Streptomyces palmae]
MTTTEDKLRHYLKRVTLDLGTTRQRLRDLEERHQEPIAIVGMACRYPGNTTTPHTLWNCLLYSSQ